MTQTEQPSAPTTHQSTNVSQAEIDKFSALASKWWDPNSEFKPLHAINPLRLEWIKQFLSGDSSQRGRSSDESPMAGLRCLDVGCGGGILAEAMAREGAKVKGIDLAQKSLTVARLHSLESGVEVDYQTVAVEDLALQEPEQYDVVTCMEMLEHVPEPGSIVQACAKLVKPGGWVFFSTINRNPKSFLFAIIGAEYVLNLLPRGTHQWDAFIKPSELSGSARSSGLEIQEIKGMTYNPVTEVYKLGPDTSVNYLMATRRI
ncbi:bifunctional 2-polyprenyl-6-hydroxyphenol methylase/3-demethylubiquinol 3-O-methyltransferase UbiG [Orrella marina]|uniref:Ubiquinone biosynthesis O-methyltransferase n=1 Tax=Orrella marina TaxID=2163011 RepID=A0A2R4XJW6_9BURK|nr:bifunctional 2-polyprenyl-6-hydroxyphenol methylase/3-demethylubiquinol 3-O-methyltransferase UbiG [Orrella marina]AWB34053.1 bifunctional 3-demethylubiquinol 3-O-methyltransferase/2-polyprenyl-6-hydroxyphenol methylase [Orrella marina]